MIVKKTHTNPKDMVLQMGITHFCNMHKSLESVVFLWLLVSSPLNCKNLDVIQTRVVWAEWTSSTHYWSGMDGTWSVSSFLFTTNSLANCGGQLSCFITTYLLTTCLAHTYMQIIYLTGDRSPVFLPIYLHIDRTYFSQSGLPSETGHEPSWDSSTIES